MSAPSIREDVPLAPLTSFEVGGPARFFTEVTNADELAAAFDWAASRMPVFILGGGSNLVVSDAGLDALVISATLRELSITHQVRTISGMFAGEYGVQQAAIALAILVTLWGVLAAARMRRLEA